MKQTTPDIPFQGTQSASLETLVTPLLQAHALYQLLNLRVLVT